MLIPDQNNSPARSSEAPRGAWLAAWMFPIVCWLVATMFLGGNLGKSTDDYSINLRDPVTYAVPSPFNPLERYPFFWRPLHNTMCFAVGTLWPEANRSVHFFVALFHGLSCLGLYLFARELTRTRLAPALAALLFMVYPLHGEVAFWFCTTSTAIGSAIFFAAALLALRFARHERPQPLLLAALFGLVFIVTCFYEQSAALCAVLPFACLAVSPRTLGWPRRLARAIAVTAVAGMACMLYIALLLITAPPTARGGSGSIVTAERLLPRLNEFMWGVHYDTIGERARQLFLGGLQTGWETLHSPRGLVAVSFLVATGLLWAIWATRRGGLRDKAAADASPSRFLLLGGIATFLAGWLPVLIIDRQIVEMRNTYVPLLGAAMALAAGLDLLLAARVWNRPGAARAGRLAVTLAALCGIAVGVTSLVGFQTYLHNRWKQDQREVAELKRLVPNPPPHTVFVPMRTSAAATHTGYVLFDHARHGVFETPWSAHAAIAFAYRRNDLGATSFSPWMPPPKTPLDKPDADGACWKKGLSKSMQALFPADPDGGLRIPWANMVPFVTEPPAKGNELRLIRRLQAERADHRDLDVRPPLVAAALAAARSRQEPAPATTFRFLDTTAEDIPASLISIDMWKHGDGTNAQFVSVHPWNMNHRATWLASEAGPRASMWVQMPPLDRPELLLIRATIADYDLNPARNPIARVQELTVAMGSAPDRPIATMRLDPLEFISQKRWMPLIVTLPARPGPAGDRIILSLRDSSERPVRTDPADTRPIPAGTRGAALPVWVTQGYEQAIVPAK